MNLVVYLDVYIFINLLMDCIILKLVSKVSKLHVTWLRIIMGSVIGAIGATIILICSDLHTFLRCIFSYVILTYLMIRITYSIKSIRIIFQTMIVLYAVTCLVGGTLTLLLTNASVTKILYEVLGIETSHSISIWLLLISVAIIVLIAPFIVKYVNQFRGRMTNIFQVTIQLEEKSISARGLLDTGNHLREPMSGKPVMIVEKTLMSEILTKELMEYTTRLKVIPYRSIGKEHGTMYGIVLDRISVTVNEEKHEHKNVVACMYEGTLSSKKEYQLILHEELL